MENLKKTFEKNIEWMALGLAGLWVLSLIWMYAIRQRVYVEIKGNTYSVSTVDDAVTEQARILERNINSNIVPPLPNPGKSVELGLVTNLSGNIGWASLHSPPSRSVILSPDAPGAPDAPQIASLPEIPPIKIVEFQSDRDQVVMPKIEKNDPAKPAGAAGGALPPGFAPRAFTPGLRGTGEFGNRMAPPRMLQPAGAAPAAAPAFTVVLDPTVPPVDKYFVILFGKFSEAALDAAFLKAKIPPFLNSREYISLQLVRQELMPDGTWGNETEIAPLPMNAPPYDRIKDLDSFLAWAFSPEGQLLIIQPPFYQTVNNKWAGGPPIKNAVQDTPAEAFDPYAIAEQVKNMSFSERDKYYKQLRLTTEQMGKVSKALQEIRDKEAAEKIKSNAGGKSTDPKGGIIRPPITPRGGPPGYTRDAQDPAVLREMYAQAAPTPTDPRNPYGGIGPGFRRPGLRPFTPGMRPMNPMMPMNPNMRVNEPGQANVVRPANPALGEPPVDFDVWAHDETVEPGKTYRYKMRLRVKNPVWNTNMAKEPAMAKILELPADKDKSWSDWSKPIDVKPRVQMFLAGGAAANNPQIRVNLYSWQKGKYNTAQALAVGAGDMIGGPDSKSGIDYTTGLTIVDFRNVGNDCRVTMVDENGAQKTRYLKADSSDPARKEIEQELAKQKAEADAAAGVNNPNPVTPPPMNPLRPQPR